MTPRMPRFNLFSGALALFVMASPSQAVPDWRKDGRLGYTTRTEAESVARMYTAPGGPRAGLGFRIRRDPDGGFTPVFFDKSLRSGAGA